MKKLTINKDAILDVIRGALFSVLLAVAFVLIFALIIKYTELSEDVIAPVNIAIKTLSIFLGTVFGVRHAKGGLVKGGIIGVLFMLITYLLFSAVSGSFTANTLTVYDFLMLLVEGVISGVFAVNIRGRKAC